MQNKTAVFIDYENVNLTDSYNLLFSKLIKEGYYPCVRKIVCSTLPKKTNFTDVIKDNLLDLIVSYKPIKKGTSKIIKEKNLNNADFRLYVESLKYLYNNQDINTYVIATSDDDYYELIVAIKNEGKFLIGVGNKATTSQSFKDLFNKFYYVEDLLNEVNKEEVKQEVVKKEEKIISSKKKTTKKEIKQSTKTNNKSIKPEAKKETKKIKKAEKKETYKKDKIFYSVLKNAISEELNTAKTKNENSYFISNLISKVKTDLPYLKNYRKITKTDIEKCGFKIEYENDEQVKGYIKII